MNSTYTFLTEIPQAWIMVIICLLLLIVFGVLEYRKAIRYKGLRMLLICLSICALLLVGLRPAYLTELPSQKAVLLTAPLPDSQLDSLLTEYPEAELFSLYQESGTQATKLPHVSSLQKHLQPKSSLIVAGNNVLPKDELRYLNAYKIDFIEPPLKAGIYTLNYTESFPLGDSLKVTGGIRLESDSSYIKLSLAGNTLDSLMLKEGERETSFQLTTIPTLSGTIDYHIGHYSLQGDTLEQLPIQLEIRENPAISIALFTGYPSFEARYLKNWIATEGHALYYQAEMAPGRFNREWLNMEQKRPSSLNRELLQSVNLLILDQAYWNKLSSAQVNLIRAAVESDGLGLLLLAQGGLWHPSSKGWNQLPKLTLGEQLQEGTLAVGDYNSQRANVSYFTGNTSGWNFLLSSESGNPLFIFRQQVLGRIGVSLIERTYPLILNQQEAAYHYLWTEVVNSLLKPSGKTDRLEVDFPAYKGMKHRISLWSEENEMPYLIMTEPNGRQQVLPLIQDAEISARWHAYHWPIHSGTYRLNIREREDSLSFKVYETTVLPALQQHDRLIAMRSFVEAEQVRNLEDNSGQKLYRAVSPLWFYLLFLLGMTGLWVLRKINGL